MMRKVIASKLTASKVEIPHFYLTIDCATGNMKDMVKALNAAAKDGEYKISINDFIVKAAALACKQVLCALMVNEQLMCMQGRSCMLWVCDLCVGVVSWSVDQGFGKQVSVWSE